MKGKLITEDDGSSREDFEKEIVSLMRSIKKK